MRILVVQESDWLEKGPHQSHHLMERMTEKGHEVKVIDFEILWRKHERRKIISKREIFEGVHKAIDKGNVTVIRPPIIKLPVMDYLSLLINHRKEINRQIKEFKPDIIIGFGILNARIGIDIARKNGIPFVYYIIDELHRLVPQAIFRRYARHVEKWNMKNSNLVLSINEGLRNYTIEMGASENKTGVIRAGIDFDLFNMRIDGSVVRKELGIRENDIVLFFMGWLYNFSGLKEVSEELSRGKKEFEKIKLFIIGKGELSGYLQNIRKKEGMDERIILLDWQPYDKIPRLLSAADICILPAYRNGIMMNIVPIKIYEYMAMGKPVIATGLPGIMREFGKGNGVLYIDNPQDLIALAVSLRKDDIIREGRKAREFVNDFDWETITEEFYHCLEKVIKNAR